MARKTTKEHIFEKINKLRSRVKDIIIRTTFIVGFPGETEEDFNETLDIVNTLKYDLAYTFIFSNKPIIFFYDI